jgi:hypothetical protein
VHPWFAQDVGQLAPSQSSPGSTTPLPHTGAQSPSVSALQPVAGQQPSLATMHVMIVAEATHWRWHPVPCKVRAVQPMFGHEVGQLAPSQSSPISSTPLPHTGEQSLSFNELHAPGQHPSLFTHMVCVPVFTQAAVHVPAFANERSMQACCGQLIGHVDTGSQVSLGLSTMPLPHVAGQSTSRFAGDVLQPGGQHPSIDVPLHGRSVVEQRALHVAGEPVNV